jgi:hypothetical protein
MFVTLKESDSACDSTKTVSKQYGETGFVPTVTGHSRSSGGLVLETLDSREATDLVRTEDGLERVGDLVTAEQQEQLALYERAKGNL